VLCLSRLHASKCKNSKFIIFRNFIICCIALVSGAILQFRRNKTYYFESISVIYHSCTMKKEAVHTAKTSVNLYQTKRRHISQYANILVFILVCKHVLAFIISRIDTVGLVGWLISEIYKCDETVSWHCSFKWAYCTRL
jgi:hypothetical protein